MSFSNANTDIIEELLFKIHQEKVTEQMFKKEFKGDFMQKLKQQRAEEYDKQLSKDMISKGTYHYTLILIIIDSSGIYTKKRKIKDYNSLNRHNYYNHKLESKGDFLSEACKNPKDFLQAKINKELKVEKDTETNKRKAKKSFYSMP